LVGDVDFLSVVGLGLSIVLISVAFERVAKLKNIQLRSNKHGYGNGSDGSGGNYVILILQFITPYLLHKQQPRY
jgi:hypothetical protein